MSYYTAGFRSCATDATIIVMNLDDNLQPSTSAQCGAFAQLLESALAMNGIHSNWITVNAAYQVDPNNLVKMAIKEWCFIGATGCASGVPNYNGEANYKYRLFLNGGDWMFPQRLPTNFGDLENRPGSQGQGGVASTNPSFTPVEKVFDRHFIVQIPTLDGQAAAGNQYYDPSYGVRYPSEVGFEAQAVAGYVFVFPDGQYHVALPVPGVPNIQFTPIPQNSK